MDTNAWNMVFGIIGTIGTIIGVVGIILTVKSTKKKEPVYSIKNRNVISDYSSKYEHLIISYNDEKVENFSISRVLFFNKGAITLNRDDIAGLNPLKIEANSGDILDTTVLQVNNPSSGFQVSLDRANRWITLDFDYLNQQQGGVIEVIHTGLSATDIKVVGDMKEVESLIEILPERIRSQSGYESVSRLTILLLFLIAVILMEIVRGLLAIPSVSRFSLVALILGLVLSAIFLCFTIII